MLVVVSWIFVATIIRIILGSWWQPAAIFTLVMAVSAIGTKTFAPEYYLSLEANLYLQILAFAACTGHYVIARRRDTRLDLSQELVIDQRRIFLLVGWSVAGVLILLTLSATGDGPDILFNPAKLADHIQATTKVRYTVGLQTSIFSSLASAYMIAYGVIVAAHCVTIQKIDWFIASPLLGYLLSNTLITTRAPIVMLLICMILAAAFADRQSQPTGRFSPLFSKRYMKYLLAVATILLVIFFYLQTLRFGASSGRSASEVWAHLRKYPWGSLPGFSLWFDGLVPQTAEHLPGFYTFMGVFDSLGFESRIVGAYTDYYVLAGSELGNIYTAVRGLIDDFGWAGSVVALAMLGALGSLATSSILSARVALALYVGVGAFFAFSFVISFYAFASNLLALFIVPTLFQIFTSNTIGSQRKRNRK